MAVAVDASSPAIVVGAGGAATVTTAAFNPPACVLVACAMIDGTQSPVTDTRVTFSNNGAALTWTMAVDNHQAGPEAMIGVAVLPAARTGMTVSATMSPVNVNIDTCLKVYCVTGADTLSASPIGATNLGNTGSTGADVITPSFVTQAASSLGIVACDEWNTRGAITSSDTTFVSGRAAGRVETGSGYKVLGAAGTTATFNLNGGGTAADKQWAWAAVEIKAAPSSIPVTLELITETFTPYALTTATSQTYDKAGGYVGVGAMVGVRVRTPATAYVKSGGVSGTGASNGTKSITTPTTYYVDASAPNDSGNGLSPATAWQSLTKVNSTVFGPGDSILFSRGKSWTGTLTISSAGTAANPIIVGAYGSGALPIINANGNHGVDVTGAYVIVEYLDVRNAGVANSGIECGNIRVSAAPNVVVSNCTLSNGTVGVLIIDSPSCRVTKCTLTNNNKMVVNDASANNDYGAQGISIGRSDNCEVDHCTGTGHVATSTDYGYDGGFIELFNSNGAHIHHNVSTGNLTFIEAGQSNPYSCDDGWVHHNLIVADATVGGGAATALVLRGSTDFFGPTYGYIFEHNTVSLGGTNPNSTAVGVAGSTGTRFVCRARNNIIIAANNAFFTGDATLLEQSYNLVNGNSNVALGTGSLTSAPQFVGSSDYHITSTSPARNAGLAGLGYSDDLDGYPLDTQPDMGAYEFRVAVAKTGGVSGIGSSSGAKVLTPATVRTKTGGASGTSAASGAKQRVNATTYTKSGSSAAVAATNGAKVRTTASIYNKTGGAQGLSALRGPKSITAATVYAKTGGTTGAASASGLKAVSTATTHSKTGAASGTSALSGPKVRNTATTYTKVGSASGTGSASGNKQIQFSAGFTKTGGTSGTGAAWGPKSITTPSEFVKAGSTAGIAALSGPKAITPRTIWTKTGGTAGSGVAYGIKGFAQAARHDKTGGVAGIADATGSKSLVFPLTVNKSGGTQGFAALSGSEQVGQSTGHTKTGGAVAGLSVTGSINLLTSALVESIYGNATVTDGFYASVSSTGRIFGSVASTSQDMRATLTQNPLAGDCSSVAIHGSVSVQLSTVATIEQDQYGAEVLNA